MTSTSPLDVAYAIGAPATIAIVASMGTLYAVQKWGWGIGKPQTNGTAGAKSVDYWKTEIRDTVEQSIDKEVVPILSRQTDILDEMRIAITRLVTLAESRERREK